MGRLLDNSVQVTAERHYLPRPAGWKVLLQDFGWFEHLIDHASSALLNHCINCRQLQSAASADYSTAVAAHPPPSPLTRCRCRPTAAAKHLLLLPTRQGWWRDFARVSSWAGAGAAGGGGISSGSGRIQGYFVSSSKRTLAFVR